jgi:hypothetical protein
MNLTTRIRWLLGEKLHVRITRRRRGPFVLIRPDGLQTEHRTKKEALQRLLAELRTTDSLEWKIAILGKRE